MKTPKRATYLLREEHPVYPVIRVHFNTRLVTLQDGERSFNTVNIRNVEFDFAGFTQEEKAGMRKKSQAVVDRLFKK